MADKPTTSQSSASPAVNGSPPVPKTHLVAATTVDAVLVTGPWRLPLKEKVSEVMKRIRAVSHDPVEVKEYIPATTTDLGVPESSVVVQSQGSHIVFFFPKESGYELLHTAGFIGPNVKLNLKAAHEGAFNIVQLRTRDRTIAYRLTFVENGIVKKIEPIFYKDNGLSIEVEPQDKNTPKPRPMIFPSWERLLKQLGNVAKHILYVSIPKDSFDNFTTTTAMEMPQALGSLAPISPLPLASLNQLYVLSIACSYTTTTYIPGPKNDGTNFASIFNSLGTQPQVINRQPQVKSLNSPTLQEILLAMDLIYTNAAKGDTVVFYFSGYGRQIFRPESPNETDAPTRDLPPNNAAKQEPEPFVGLIPSNTAFDYKEIDEVTDLTNIWIRYWINALYLIKNVASVIVLLDTSFSDPGPDYHGSDSKASTTASQTTQESVVRIRSHRPRVMSAKCTLDLPKSIEELPSWFVPGKALDSPADSLRVHDNINECPYYFAPSRQWASKHVVFQASRDNELAYERQFYATVDEIAGPDVAMRFEPYGKDEGKFTHFLVRVLRSYFAQDVEPPIALETYPLLMARINSAGKDELDNQHPVCFIGETKRYEKIFSPVRVIAIHANASVEASRAGGNFWSGTGFVGLPLTTESLQLAKAPNPGDSEDYDKEKEQALRALATPVQPSIGYDSFLQQYQLVPAGTEFERSLQPLAVQPGKLLQVMPLPNRQLSVAVPHGTRSNDPELASFADSLRQELVRKGIASDVQLIEHSPPNERHTMWEWTLFDRHPWGRVSKERTSEVRLFAQSLEQKTWPEIQQLTRTFVDNLRARIYDSVSKDIASKVRMTFPDIANSQRTSSKLAVGSPLLGVSIPSFPKTYRPPPLSLALLIDYRATLQRFRAWLLERSEDVEYAETVNATNRLVLFKALNSLTDAIDKAPLDEKQDLPFVITMCRNNVIPPTEDAFALRRRFGFSHRLLAPVAIMASLILPLTKGTIAREGRRDRSVGSYLAPHESHWKSQRDIANGYPGLSGRKEMIALYWLNFYDFLAPRPSATALLDPPEWLQMMEGPLMQSKGDNMTLGDNVADVAQGYVLAGCWYLSRDPQKAIDSFVAAEALLVRTEENAAFEELQINKMLAYVSFNDGHENFDESKAKACLLLVQIAQRYQGIQLPLEHALACLYTLARLSEHLPNECRVAGGEDLWPIPSDVIRGCNLPAWSAVAEFVIRQYLGVNKNPLRLSTDDKENVFMSVVYKHNKGLLEEAAGNYGKALKKFNDALVAVKTLPLRTSPLENDPSGQADRSSEISNRVLRNELRAFVAVNVATTRALFTRANVISMNQNASHSTLSTGNLSSIFVLDWAHYLAACNSSQAALVYNAVRSGTSRGKQPATAALFLKRLISNYQLFRQGHVDQKSWNQAAKETIRAASSPVRMPKLASVPEPGSSLEFEMKHDALALPSLMMGSLLPLHRYYHPKGTPSGPSRATPAPGGIYNGGDESKWRSLEDEDFKAIRQFLLELPSPLFGTLSWQMMALLVFGMTSCDFKNYRVGLQFFVRVFDRLDSANYIKPVPFSRLELAQLQDLGGEYIRFANRQSQFFLASIPPQEIDAFHCQPDKDTNCTTYLCPPMEWTELSHIAVLWYWRAIKIDTLVNAQLRRVPNAGLGYRNLPPIPLGLQVPPTPLPESQFSTDFKLGPVNLLTSIVTKVATAVPRAHAFLLHDSERIEMKVQLRDPLKNSELDGFKRSLVSERKDTLHPKKRYRFHVLDCRSDGTIKILTRGTNMSGHAINILFHTADNSTTARLGAITTQHEIVSLFFKGSVYELRSPLTHVFVLMLREDIDSAPPLFDCRFFEQTPAIDIDAYTRRSVIRRTWEELQGQFEQRLLTRPNAALKAAPVIDGDTFQVEWLRIRSAPNPSLPTKLFQPSVELRSKVLIASGKPDTYRGIFKTTPSTATGQTRASPLTHTNAYARNISHIQVNTSPLLVPATPQALVRLTDLSGITRAEASDIAETDKIYSSVPLPSASDDLLCLNSDTSRPPRYHATRGGAEGAAQNANFISVLNCHGHEKERDEAVSQIFKTAKALTPTVLWNLRPLGEVQHADAESVPLPPALPNLGGDEQALAATAAASLSQANSLLVGHKLYAEKLRETAYLIGACIVSFTDDPPTVIIANGTPDPEATKASNVPIGAFALALDKDTLLQRIRSGFSDPLFEKALFNVLFGPIEGLLPTPAPMLVSTIQSAAPRLLVITSHGSPDLLRVPYAALTSSITDQCLGESYLLALQPSLHSFRQSLVSFARRHRHHLRLVSRSYQQPDLPRGLVIRGANVGPTSANVLKTLFKGTVTLEEVDEANLSQEVLIPPQDKLRWPIKFIHAEGSRDEVQRWVQTLKGNDKQVPVEVETLIQTNEFVDFPPEAESIICAPSTKVAIRAAASLKVTFFQEQKPLHVQFWEDVNAVVPKGVIPGHKLQNWQTIVSLTDILSTIAMCHLVLQDLDSTTISRIRIKAAAPAPSYDKTTGSLSEQLALIKLSINRFDTYGISHNEFDRNPVAGGHISVLNQEFSDGYYWYSTTRPSTPEAMALSFFVALKDQGVVEKASMPDSLADVCHAVMVCVAGSCFPQDFRALGTSLEALKESTLDLVRQTNGAAVLRPTTASMKPPLVALSALASFLAWDLGDAQFKCELALAKLNETSTPAVDNFENLLATPLKKTLVVLLEIINTVLPAARTFYRLRSKAAVVRNTQVQMSGRIGPLPGSLGPSSVIASRSEWGNLILYGLPYNATEGHAMRPEKLLALQALSLPN